MKKFYYILILLLSSGMLMTANAQEELATFEDPEIDFFDKTGTYDKDARATLTVVENPSKTGINKTDQCLKNWRSGDYDWSSAVSRIYNSVGNYITITEENRYLHIMAYSDVASGCALFVTTGSNDNVWDYKVDDSGDYQVRFTFKAGEWIDVVYDLYGKNQKTLYGFYFMSQDWQAPKVDRIFYFDEIILNDDPEPRTATGPGPAAGVNDALETTGAVYGIVGGITINDIEGEINVYNLQGVLVYQGVSAGELTINLNSGLYIVSAGGENYKVLVK